MGFVIWAKHEVHILQTHNPRDGHVIWAKYGRYLKPISNGIFIWAKHGVDIINPETWYGQNMMSILRTHNQDGDVIWATHEVYTTNP